MSRPPAAPTSAPWSIVLRLLRSCHALSRCAAALCPSVWRSLAEDGTVFLGRSLGGGGGVGGVVSSSPGGGVVFV